MKAVLIVLLQLHSNIPILFTNFTSFSQIETLYEQLLILSLHVLQKLFNEKVVLP